MIKERPILMSAPMVRAIPEGKTQTRRTRGLDKFCANVPEGFAIDYFVEELPGEWLAISDKEGGEFPSSFKPWIKCPYGKAGDRLWVKEPWRVGAWVEMVPALAIDYLADGYVRKEWIHIDNETHIKLVNQSILDCERSDLVPLPGFRYQWEPGKAPTRKRPAMFMPRWASRILLEITGIRVERLQDISEDDAIAEGILFNGDYELWWDYQREQWICVDPIDSYKSLICKINGPETWEKNPWVWIVEFKVIEVKER